MPSNVSFGTLLAFVAPGFVAFVAMAYHLPTAAAWLEAAQKSQQSIGVFFFAALASVALGVIVGGLRGIIADPFFCSGCLGAADSIALPKAGFAKLRDKDVLAAFQAAIENYYRYYQFYSNMAVALLLLAISRLIAASPPPWPKWWPVVLLLLVIVLGISAYGSLRRYAAAATEILG